MTNEKQQTNGDPFEGGPAAQTNISLSQALLAPLDALFKAQLHAARSFLNLLLQLGYPHQSLGSQEESGEGTETQGAKSPTSGVPYNLEFFHEIMIDGTPRKQKVCIPALALVPLAPISVESADFKFGMTVKHIDKHRQMQQSEEKALAAEKSTGYDGYKRPWFLVEDPVSMKGVVARPESKTSETEQAQESTIQIEVKLSRIPMPAGLEKLVTSLTQSGYSIDVK